MHQCKASGMSEKCVLHLTGPLHSVLLVTPKHCNPAKCLLHRSTHSKLTTGPVMDAAGSMCKLSGQSGRNGQHWNIIVSAGPSPDTLTSSHYLYVYSTDTAQHGNSREVNKAIQVNNLATVTQSFWRLSVNTCCSFTALHIAATTRLGSLTQTLISLSVHHVRWGWLRTQNKGCLNCCAMQCGHNPLKTGQSKPTRLFRHAWETAVMAQPDWTENKPTGLCSMLCQR